MIQFGPLFMTERQSYSETLTRTGVRVILPEKLLSWSDDELEKSIAGFSTLSLSQATTGFHSNPPCVLGYSSRLHGKYINCDLTTETYTKIFTNPPYAPMDIRNLINENQPYGYFWAVYEVLSTTPPYNQIPHSTITKSGFDQTLVNMAFHPERQQVAGESFPSAMYPSMHLLVEKISVRRGVQVLWRKSLVDFIKSVGHKPADDQAVTIYSSVPAEHIFGLVPLGEYEQNLLISGEDNPICLS